MTVRLSGDSLATVRLSEILTAPNGLGGHTEQPTRTTGVSRPPRGGTGVAAAAADPGAQLYAE